MKSIKLLTEDLDHIVPTYQVNEYRVEKVTLGGEFIVVFLLFDSMDKLGENWQTLSSFFSEYLEEYLIDAFSKWNLYIIYLSNESVTKEIQYKIENNPFFARKIVEDSYTLQLSDENIQNLISEHINFTDLKIKTTQPTQKKYESTSEIYLNLQDVDTASEEQIDELLKSLEEDNQ